MQVAIAGGHGKIAMHLTRLLADAGVSILSLIRNPDHADDVRTQGAQPVLCDLEREQPAQIAQAIEGSDAVVFAAGAGPGSGAERKLTVDRDGAIKLLEAARRVGARRYLMVSAVGAENPPPGDEVFQVYLQAKAQADAAVRDSDRDWTILRPGRLTDDPAHGTVEVRTTPFRGEVPREDVAAVLAALLHNDAATGAVLYVNAGEQPVEAALRAALA